MKWLASEYRAEILALADLSSGGSSLTSSAFLTHGLATFVLLFGSWVLCCALIDLAARSAFVSSSKLQPRSKTDDPKLRAFAARVVARNWMIVALSTLVFAPVLKVLFPLCFFSPSAVGPSWWEVGVFLVFWFVTNDGIFTVFHRMFHEVGWLYQRVHKEHHSWTAPFAWMSHAMSPIELFANSVGVMFWPLFHSVVLGRSTPLELIWSVQIISQIIGCVEHSGFGALHPLVVVNPSFFPPWLFSPTKHHDDHHRLFKGNYGGYLAVWDALMGTTLRPKSAKRR